MTPSPKKGSYLLPHRGAFYEPFDHFHLPAFKLFPDEHGGYVGLEGVFYKHERINHGDGEYVRDGVTTNGIESVWAVLKRGPRITYKELTA